MKFNIISDLHCDIKKDKVGWMDFDPTRLCPADYLIVAGDTGYDNTEQKIYSEMRKLTEGKFKDILWIKGNHSYWFNEEDVPENKNIDVVDGNVAIIGTTLWTPTVSQNEKRYMNDYRYIHGFSSEEKIRRFNEESKWLEDKYNEYKSLGKKIVIVTHHNPRNHDQLPERYGDHNDVMTAYWIEDGCLDHIKPDIWICGHVHDNINVMIDGVNFYRHPIGYRWWPYFNISELNEVSGGWYNFIVEV